MPRLNAVEAARLVLSAMKILNPAPQAVRDEVETWLGEERQAARARAQAKKKTEPKGAEA